MTQAKRAMPIKKEAPKMEKTPADLIGEYSQLHSPSFYRMGKETARQRETLKNK